MSTKSTIYLYGFSAGLPDENKGIRFFDYKDMTLEKAELDPYVKFENIDLIILPFNPFKWKHDSHYKQHNLLLLAALRSALERAIHACFLCTDVERDVTKENQGYVESVGFKMVEDMLQIRTMHISTTSNFQICDRQFESFLKEFAWATDAFVSGSPFSPDIDVIAKDPDDKAIAIAVKQGKGILFFIPGSPMSYRHDFFGVLADSCMNYIRSRFYTVPPYIRDFIFTEERPLSDERTTLSEKLDHLDDKLAEFEKRKDILGLEDEALHKRIPEWLRTYLRLAIEDLHGANKEDFYILNDKEERVAIGEVKGCRQNVKREHITKLRLHREIAELPDDFPSILIVNSFTGATELRQKEQRVSPTECLKAVQDHVLIIRTLDLLRVLDLPPDKVEEFKKLIFSEVGWLKVTADGFEVIQK